jgi:hypothetical protein
MLHCCRNANSQARPVSGCERGRAPESNAPGALGPNVSEASIDWFSTRKPAVIEVLRVSAELN